MKKQVYLFFLFIIVLSVSCNEGSKENTPAEKEPYELINKNDLERIEPPNWWVGFENDSLQLLVKHENIGNFTPSILQHGISITHVSKADKSNNYLFIDLVISEEAPAGKFNIKFENDNGDVLIDTYELKDRKKSAKDYVGFDSSDAIYLITPDRFANADPNNDSFENLNEKSIDRSDNYARHGGDIVGVIEHLDYIHDLGFTAVWPQPMLINDMAHGSYHGYAITDLYQVDPRFGTLEEYQKLSQELKTKGHETYHGPSGQPLRT